jgi:hypothetical protein
MKPKAPMSKTTSKVNLKDDPNGKKKRVNPIVNPTSVGAATAGLGLVGVVYGEEIAAGAKKLGKKIKKKVKGAFSGSPKRTSDGVVKRKK